MGKYVFNINKFREWRKFKDKLPDETIELIIEFQDLEQYDGCTYDYMFNQGKLVIKDWCDYVEVDDRIRI